MTCCELQITDVRCSCQPCSCELQLAEARAAGASSVPARPRALGPCSCTHGQAREAASDRPRRCWPAGRRGAAPMTEATPAARLGRWPGGGPRGGGTTTITPPASARVARCLISECSVHQASLESAVQCERLQRGLEPETRRVRSTLESEPRLGSHRAGPADDAQKAQAHVLDSCHCRPSL